MSREDWIWMPHPAHLCVAHWCRFHLATYVNGHVISTVGEYFPDSSSRRGMLEWELKSPFNRKNKEEIEKTLSQQGDAFDRYYLHFFDYDDIGCNRKYETMVFAAERRVDECCPYDALVEFNVDMMGYNCPGEATKGHYAMCEKFDKLETIKRKYRKKPVVIEAYQWFPGMKTDDVVEKPPGSSMMISPDEKGVFDQCGYIDTLEGKMVVSRGDYIITGIKGEKYPCKPDIFEQTYDEVDDEE